jgi:lysophospholipase L1-like esterase
MSKLYTRVGNGNGWADYPSTNTPRNAFNFNIMDKGIDDLDNAIVDHQAQIDRLVIDGDSSPAIAQALADTEFQTLRDYRIANDSQLAAKAKQVDLNATNEAVALRAEKVYVDSKFGSMGNAKRFMGSCTSTELTAKTGMVVDDYWYVTDLTTNKCYNGTSWVDIGNSLDLGDGAVTKNKFDAKMRSLLIDQYTDLGLMFTDVGFYGIGGESFTSAGYLKLERSVLPGDTYKITGYSYLTMRLYIMMDANNNVVSYFPTAQDSAKTKYTDIVITIPKNVTKLRINKIDNISNPVIASLVTGHIIDESKVSENYTVYGKQLYDANTHNINGYWILPTGGISADSASKYAKIPVKPNESVAMCRNDTVAFDATHTGAVLLLDSNSQQISYIDPANYISLDTYNTYKYITFKTPSNCAFIAYTVKLGTTYDISSSIIVIYGDEITDEIINNNEIFKLREFHIADKSARDSIASLNAKYKGKKWAVPGDSLTERNARATKNYHDYIAEETGITVVNMGLSGSGYKNMEPASSFYGRILNVPLDTDVVTIFGSGNDLTYVAQGLLGNVADTDTNTICGCINKTIDNLYSVMPTVPIGIITPCPWVSYPPSEVGNNMELYSEKLIEICKRRSIPCLDLYHESNLRPWDSNFRTLMYSRDEGNGVHPDENGHKILATKIREFLYSLI